MKLELKKISIIKVLNVRTVFFFAMPIATTRWTSNTSVNFSQAGLLTGDEVVAPPREALVRIHYLIIQYK